MSTATIPANWFPSVTAEMARRLGITLPEQRMKSPPAGQHFDRDEVKRASEGRWFGEILPACGFSRDILNGQHCPCPRCGGTDRFRAIDAAAGAVFCNQCFRTDNGDGFAAVMWLNGWDFSQAVKEVAECVGVRGQTSGRREPTDIVQHMARLKQIPLPSFIAFGAKEDRRGRAKVARVPMWDEHGNQCSYCDFADTDEKFRKGMSAKGQPVGLYYAERPQPGDTILITEGPKDSAALHSLGFKSVGLPTSKLSAKFGRVFAGCDVIIVPDLDRTGEESAPVTAARLKGIAASVRIARLPGQMKAADGDGVREILALADGEALVRQAIEDAVPVSAESIPEVNVTPEEHRVISDVVATLHHATDIYQRGGRLVRILSDDCPPDLAIERQASKARIGELPLPTLRETITKLARLVDPFDESGSTKHPPPWLVTGIASRGNWPGVRHLETVVTFPVMRSNGTIVSESGYDPATGLFVDSDINITVPEHPTQADAKAAVESLLNLVKDFPFAKPAHKNAWLAFVLTQLVRFAFHGPAPLFLVDSNVRGSGKTLLAELGALIVTGKSLSRMANPESDKECRNCITAIVLAGTPLVLIDNIVGAFGCGSLDAALTSTIWKDRILGGNEMVELPLCVTWIASGNNVQLAADTGRRVCHIRLQSPEENPEDRSDFQVKDIAQHVRDNRSKYLSDALTILRAYHVAGRPSMNIRRWGSFEGWSAAIREPLVWCGLDDPALTREEFIQLADREAGAIRQLIAGWNEIDPDCDGVTVGDAIRMLEGNRERFATLRTALEELAPPQGGKFNTRSIGRRLMHLRGRNCGGFAIDARPDRKGVQKWRVVPIHTGDPTDTTNAGFAVDAGFDLTPSCSLNSDNADSTNNSDTQLIQTHQREGAETNPAIPANPAEAGEKWWEAEFPT